VTFHGLTLRPSQELISSLHTLASQQHHQFVLNALPSTTYAKHLRRRLYFQQVAALSLLLQFAVSAFAL
jgi:hypothetical protein